MTFEMRSGTQMIFVRWIHLVSRGRGRIGCRGRKRWSSGGNGGRRQGESALYSGGVHNRWRIMKCVAWNCNRMRGKWVPDFFASSAVARDHVKGGYGVLWAPFASIRVLIRTEAWGAETGVRSGGVTDGPFVVFGALGGSDDFLITG